LVSAALGLGLLSSPKTCRRHQGRPDFLLPVFAPNFDHRRSIPRLEFAPQRSGFSSASLPQRATARFFSRSEFFLVPLPCIVFSFRVLGFAPLISSASAAGRSAPQFHEPLFLAPTAGPVLFLRVLGFRAATPIVYFSTAPPPARVRRCRVSCRALGSAPPAGFQTFPPWARVLVAPRLTVRTHPVQTTSRSGVLDRSRNSEIPMALEMRQAPCFC
jgi:hypothetical protein